MKSRPKDIGTAFETWMVNWLNRVDGVVARRLPEGGARDQGDLTWYDVSERTFYAECKSTAALNVTRTLSKARLKSPDPKLTVLFWKRNTRTTPDAKRRTPDGEPVVAVLALDTFHELIRMARKGESR